MRFSIIVPIYNVENYIKQCIDSVLNQTFRDYELILVDDGSPDRCPQICDMYASKDARVRVIHKKNGGLSDARNAGLKAATGQYVLFIDSDDYWNSASVLEKIDEILQKYNVEIVHFGRENVYIGDNITTPNAMKCCSQYNGMCPDDVLGQMVSDDALTISACVMAMSRSFLIKHGLFFKRGIKTEDLEWATRFYICEPRWAFLDDNFYVYRVAREGSITSGIDYKHLCDYCWILEQSVLSSTSWSHDNSFGNSFSNIFEGIENIEIANIACRPGYPTSYLVTRYFQLSEKFLLRNLKNKAYPSGVEIASNEKHGQRAEGEDLKARKFGQKKRWQILFWARDFIWAVGRWKSPQLNAFIDDFKPDLIFQPVYYSSYLNDIAQYIKKRTGAPMVGYISDDCYTLKQFSLSPLYWIDRLYKRRKVKKTIEMCELLYVISDIQKEEYEKCFTTPCKILTKGADFSDLPTYKVKHNEPLQLVFTGNIGTNRWRSLQMIADALEKINQDGIKAQLRIYTATPLTKKMEKALNRGESSILMGSVPASEVPGIQEKADILVHVEALDLKNKLTVRQSFSTKIVDYLKAARPILAVGPKDVASIDHLIRNDCAIVADNRQELESKLRAILDDKAMLNEIAQRGYECGRKHHNKQDIQTMLMNDLNSICSK